MHYALGGECSAFGENVVEELGAVLPEETMFEQYEGGHTQQKQEKCKEREAEWSPTPSNDRVGPGRVTDENVALQGHEQNEDTLSVVWNQLAKGSGQIVVPKARSYH